MQIRDLDPQLTRPEPIAAEDPGFQQLDVAIKRYQYQQDALIEILHVAQADYGYLSDDLLRYVARCLKLPPSHVYGVATFYHLFSLQPRGQHSCVVCNGTACYVQGAATLMTALERYTQTSMGQTTADGQLSLGTARCLGACGSAPVVVVDQQMIGHQTPETVITSVKEYVPHGSR
jgi:bidirectional [NiFe] hydrogenase diaphorase subunit